MKYLSRILILILALAAVLSCFTACDGGEGGDETTAPAEGEIGEFVDLAGTLKFDPSSGRVYTEATVKTYIDGDTVHFHVSNDVVENGVLKARFLGINTPESTGKIEEYGKAASAFTRQKLTEATSIILESDDDRWNRDSTGDRYLVWVWYRTAEDQPYRNLNIEILQEGLAIANSSANNRYGDVCMAAINQAKAHKLKVYSGQPDPDFFYGEAVELTLRELRTNVADYNGMKVAFSGIITMNDGGSIYIEDFDEETGMLYGISVYYGYGLSGAGLDILTVGNESRIVGTVQY
jgi:micrococcal nuclease